MDFRQSTVLVLEIKVAIPNIWSKIVLCIFVLFCFYDMILLNFNNYPQIFFALVGVFVFKRLFCFILSKMMIFSVLGGRVLGF